MYTEVVAIRFSNYYFPLRNANILPTSDAPDHDTPINLGSKVKRLQAITTAHQGVQTLGLIVLHQAIESLFRFSLADLVSFGP